MQNALAQCSGNLSGVLSLIRRSQDSRAWWRYACATFLICALTSISAPAVTFTTLVTFDGTNGANPNFGSLVQGLDGNLYGTTQNGGSGTNCTVGCGTVFKMTPTGTVTTLHSFNSDDGRDVLAGLVLATDGNFYGITGKGGAHDDGAIFKISANGQFTLLHSFSGADGLGPSAGLVQGSDGSLYGATTAGGNTSTCPIGNSGCGVIFKITTTGTFKTLHVFSGPDGAAPSGTLIQVNGAFYGTTSGGGDNGDGTVFKISPAGVLKTLHSFKESDGRDPLGALVPANDNNFYGTTVIGGTQEFGTIFKMIPAGTLTTLHSFHNTDGGYPTAGLIQGTDLNLYGTTEIGGSGYGTVYKITLKGALSTLHKFALTGGANPVGGVVQATNGKFYGGATNGGDTTHCSGGCGIIFSIDVALKPFVASLPTSGKTGTAVKILGNHLTGTTSVTFNGTAATFTVLSDTQISTAVPGGATTGFIKVKAPAGTLTSNKKFVVTP